MIRAQKLAGHRRRLQPKEIFDLRRGDQQRDAVGEADRHRARNELDRRAQAGEAHDQQQNARHDSDQRQAGHAEFRDDAGDDHDKGARRPADLSARSAQRRNQKPGHDGRIEAGLRRHARGDREGHRQRQRDQSDRHAGDEVLRELSDRVAAQALNRTRQPLLRRTHRTDSCGFSISSSIPRASFRWAWK